MSLVSRGYWREVRRRVIEESIHPFGGKGGFALVVTSAVLAIPVVGMVAGWGDAKVEMFIASVPLIIMITLLLVNAIRAPRLIHEESLKSIAGIERQRDQLIPQKRSHEDRQRIAKTLGALHEYGVHKILGAYTSTLPFGAFERIVQQDDEWVADLLKKMEELGCNVRDINRVGTLKTYDVIEFTSVKKVNKRASMVNTRLDRLQEVIDKYVD